jgi:hypothetical protein
LTVAKKIAPLENQLRHEIGAAIIVSFRRQALLTRVFAADASSCG